MSLEEMVLRLTAATVIGGVVGLNRDLHGKATGVRTLGLVALGSALIVIGIDDLLPRSGSNPDPLSRVIQGVLTGIGFLGAGVILHGESFSRVRGLTTAALTWLTACIGLICGTGNWRLIGVAVALTFVLLIVGGPIEKWLHRRFAEHQEPAPPGA